MLKSKDEVELLIIKVVTDYLNSQGETTEILSSTQLIGQHAVVDSLGLVNVIVDLEAELGENGHTLSLSFEKAFSMRQSPFKNIGTLGDTICSMVNLNNSSQSQSNC